MNDEELTHSEIEELGRVMDSLSGYEHDLEEPPEFVWHAIEAGLEDFEPVELDVDRTYELDGPIDFDELDLPFEFDEPAAAESSVAMDSRPHDHVVSELQPRRRIRTYLAAAAVLIIAVFGLANFLGSDPEEILVASGDISNEDMPLELPASGTATLVSVDGVFQLDVDVEQLETDTGYFELWVSTSDASEVRSLGAIDSDGRFDLPEDFDPDVYPAVAISLEEDDGDPSFSGVAVLFGVLDQ